MTAMNRKSVESRTKKGFTLVELLVVIGIIALLVSILLSALNKARQQAATLKCQANLHQIGHLIQLYANNNRGSLPWGFYSGVDPWNYDANKECDWTTLLANVMDNTSGPDYAHTKAWSAVNPGSNGVFVCPSAMIGDGTGFITHYSAHPRLMPANTQYDGYASSLTGYAHGFYLSPYILASIRHPSDIALIFDGSLKNSSGGGDSQWGANVTGTQLDQGRIWWSSFLTDDPTMDTASYMNLGNPIDTSSNSGSASTWNTDTDDNWSNVRFRHRNNDQAGVLFCDGHAEVATAKDNHNCTLTRRNVEVPYNFKDWQGW